MKNHKSQLTGIVSVFLAILFLITLIGCAPSSDDNGNSKTSSTTDNPGFVLRIQNNSTTTSGVTANTTEAGGTTSFTVKLADQPSATVTIPVSSSDVSEGTVSSTSLSFTTANWNAEQTVTITGVDDNVQDGNQSYDPVDLYPYNS